MRREVTTRVRTTPAGRGVWCRTSRAARPIPGAQVHGMDARSILDAFQEATYLISAWVVHQAPAVTGGGVPSRRAGRSRRRGRAHPAEARTGDRFCGGRAREIAALIVGLDRGGTRETRSRRTRRRAEVLRRRRRNGKEFNWRRRRRRRRRRDKRDAALRRRRMVCSHTISRVSANTTATPPSAGHPRAVRLALVPSAGRGAACRRVSDEHPRRRRRRVGRGDQARRRRALRLRALLDDEALAEEDVDDVARAVTDAICVRLTSLEKKPTLLRLVLFRSDETLERARRPRARSTCFQKNIKTRIRPSSPSSVPASRASDSTRARADGRRRGRPGRARGRAG